MGVERRMRGSTREWNWIAGGIDAGIGWNDNGDDSTMPRGGRGGGGNETRAGIGGMTVRE